MNIKHRPIFDIEKVIDLYTKKDGVDIKYVCTTSLNEHGTLAVDVFYRETPHPEFKNRYFGLYYNHENVIMITNADKIEELMFYVIDVNGVLHYSQHRHDFYSVGDVAIDGGRSYFRLIGNVKGYTSKCIKVRDGVFVDE